MREPLLYAEMGAEAALYSEEFAIDAGAPARAEHLAAMKRPLAGDRELAPHLHRYKLDWGRQAARPTGLEAWAERAIEVFWRQLDEETAAFARESVPTWQEQERFNLEEFTERLDGCFAGREALIGEAIEFLFGAGVQGAEAGTQAWCVTAENGAGKSAFFARVYETVRRRIGATI